MSTSTRSAALALLAVCTAIVVHSNAYENELIHDDFFAVVNNKDVTSGTPLSELWSHDFWGSPITDPASHKSYRPLTVLSFRLNHHVHGLRPFGYVVANVGLHALTTALVFCVAQVLLARTRRPRDGALATAMFFAVHPVHVEAVTSVVGRAEVVCCVAMLLSFLAGVRAAGRDGETSRGFVGAAIVLAVAAMLCKESGATAWAVLILYEVLYVGFTARGIGRQLAYVSSASVAVAWRLMLNQGPAPDFSRLMARGEGITWWRSSLYVWAYNAYLLVLPMRLSGDYKTMDVRVESWDDERNAASLALLAAAAAALRSGRREVHVACGWVALTFVPASGLFLTVGFVVAERVLYVPSFGVCLLLGLAVAGGMPASDGGDTLRASGGAQSKKRGGANQQPPPRAEPANDPSVPYRTEATAPSLAVVLALALGSCFALRTWERNRDWRSAETFWSSVLREFPDNAQAEGALAAALDAQSRQAEAEDHFLKAIELRDACATRREKKYAGLTPQQRSALVVSADQKCEDNSVVFRLNYANMLFRLGEARYAEASEQYAAVARGHPHLGVLMPWGGLFERQGKTESALNLYMLCGSAAPSNRLTLYQDDRNFKFECALRAATLHLRKGNFEEGVEWLHAAERLHPQLWEVWLHEGEPEKRYLAVTSCAMDDKEGRAKRFANDYWRDPLVKQLVREEIHIILFCGWYADNHHGLGWFQIGISAVQK